MCCILYVERVAEQRRKRLKELEQQISQLRKKMTEQEKMLKMKDQTDKSVTKLQGDIQVNNAFTCIISSMSLKKKMVIYLVLLYDLWINW